MSANQAGASAVSNRQIFAGVLGAVFSADKRSEQTDSAFLAQSANVGSRTGNLKGIIIMEKGAFDFSKTPGNPSSAKRPYFNRWGFVLSFLFLLLVVGVGAFFLIRYLGDYFAYDRPSVTLAGPKGGILSVVFSPDGQTIAGGSADGTISLWDPSTGEIRHTLKEHTARVRTIAFSPDGKTIASGGDDRELLLWDAANGKLRERRPLRYDVMSIAFSPDGQTIVVGSGALYLFNAADLNGAFREIATDEFYVLAVAFSPDGKSIAGFTRGRMKLWDVESGSLTRTLAENKVAVHPIVFSPDGRTLVGGSLEGKVLLWDVPGGNLKKTIDGSRGNKISVAISPRGNSLASGSYDYDPKTGDYHGEIELWDLESGDLTKTLARQKVEVISIAISPDGKIVASGNGDGTIGLWRLE